MYGGNWAPKLLSLHFHCDLGSMATRRRVGISNATTEAARRQLMQPVVCWEKVWSTPENAPTGSSLKVFKWVKTDRIPVSHGHTPSRQLNLTMFQSTLRTKTK